MLWLIVILIIILIIICCLKKSKQFQRNSTKYLRISEKKEIIKILLRQISRWSVASLQDNNSLIAVLHANYGAGYLWALLDIATPDEIMATGLVPDFYEFKNEVLRIQDVATKGMAKLCPEYAPAQSILTKIGGEGV